MAMKDRLFKGLPIKRAFTKKVMLAILSTTVALIVALAVLWHIESKDKWFSLDQIQDGIKCSFLRDLWSWESSHVEVDNGSGRVFWYLNDSSLSRGVWTLAEFEIQNLGDVAVRLTVVDREGDGNMSYNDYVMLTTLSSTGFTPNRLYNLTLGIGSTALTGTSVDQSFKFVDGRLVTGRQTKTTSTLVMS